MLAPLLLALTLTSTFSAPVPTAVDAWPAYRGPSGDGHADVRGLPVEWNETKNVRWKTAIHGKAWSSPVIWGKQVWVTTAPEDGKHLDAVCLDRDSGKIIHNLQIFDNPKPAFCIPANSYASSTPVIEEGRIYVHYGSPGTACLDTATGKILWQRRDLPCDHFRSPASSPILYGNLLLLTFDGFDFQYLAALDKETGQTVWKTDRQLAPPNGNGDNKKAYSTPIVITIANQDVLISPAAYGTQAFDPKTGKELWRVSHGGMNVASRPLFGHGHLFLTSGDGGKQLLAVRPDGKGDVTSDHVDWTFSKGVPTRASLVLVDDLLFMASNDGVAICVEASTGKEVKKVRLGGPMWASPLAADGKVYFFSQDGNSYVLEANREMKLLATNKLDEGFWASPAVAGKALFLRTRTHLYRIEEP
jgi:outer membrane protein assembly factor BamB